MVFLILILILTSTFTVAHHNSPAKKTVITLSHHQLEQTLDEYLDPVLSSRRTAEAPARALSQLSRAEQEFALHWTDVIRKSNAEMAYQFVHHAPRALALVGMSGTKTWLLNALDIYDKEGLYPGSDAFARIDEFAREFRANDSAVAFGEVHTVLERFIRGLAGRELKLEIGERSYTDTATLYLPARIHRFAERERNYQLYKITAVLLWAQVWFGTFRRATPDAPTLNERLSAFADPARALNLFNRLETIRLTACIERELPGLFRQLRALDQPPPMHDATWRAVAARLQQPDADVDASVDAVEKLYALQTEWPGARLYQTELDLHAAHTVGAQRIESEKNRLQEIIAELLGANPSVDANADEQSDGGDDDGGDQTDATPHELNLDKNPHGDFELQLDGDALILPPHGRRVLSSLLQDFQQLPPEWLTAAGDGAYDSREQTRDEQPSAAADALSYDEWDFRRQSYRKNWCMLHERVGHAVYDDFIAHTLDKHRHLVGEIRRHFEALRGEDKLLKAQADGDDIDLDALVAQCAEARNGAEMDGRLFTQKRKAERDLAVAFMVDVSGSTKGWINDAERESLVLLCEALEILGDQYAIYGFSGMTRNRCEIYTIKTFAQPYDREVRARISGMRPQDYTRMGVTIRHLCGLLNQVDARTRILIALSDGKPDDYDGYRGEYGIEDTRRALLEARHTGIHPFCITIDLSAADYLPHMYGHASYVVVDEVRKLPLKVADIYRKLTT